jgi:hypothetical protein
LGRLGENNLSRNLNRKAERLAAQAYHSRVEHDLSTDGSPIYIAWHPAFSIHTGHRAIRCCLAQGSIVREALENLDDARYEFISSLLEDHQPVPELASGIVVLSLSATIASQ